MSDILSEKYEKSKKEFYSAEKKENRRIAIVSAAMRILGIVIIIGAVLIFIRPAAGLAAAVSGFILFTVLVYFETNSEKKFQLSYHHMVFSPDSFKLLRRIDNSGYSEDTVRMLSEYSEKENDRRRKCVMSDILSEGYMSLGMYDEALAAFSEDKALSDEDGFFRILYNFRRMFLTVFSEKGSDSFYEAYEKLPKDADDHMSLEYLLHAEILAAYYEERYFDVLSLCETAYPDEETDRSAPFYLYLKARALYYTGKYDSAVKLTEKLTENEKNKLIQEKAAELKELLS